MNAANQMFHLSFALFKRNVIANSQFMIARLLLVLSLAVVCLTSQTYGAKPIAKIASFKGTVFIHNGKTVFRIMQIGRILNEGDRVQTKQGEVRIIFNDGAVLKVSPFTNTWVQEREEKSGFWIFKSKRTVRRVTNFVGKLWFKSGVSKRKNYLQTPTAVAGLRGSAGELGYDNKNTHLNITEGEAETKGKVIEGDVQNPGEDVAQESKVYKSVDSAYKKIEKANSTGKGLDIAEAGVDVIVVVRESASELQKNPDESIKKEAEIAGVAADAGVSAAKTKVVVEEVKEVQAKAEKAIQTAKINQDEKTLKKAQLAAKEAKKTALVVKKVMTVAIKAAEAANEAAQEQDLEKTKIAAKDAKNAEEIIIITVVASNAAVAALIAVEEIKEAQKIAEKTVEEARAGKDMKKAEDAEKALQKAKAAVIKAEAAAKKAEAADLNVQEAAGNLNLDLVKKAAEEVGTASDDAIGITNSTIDTIKDVIPLPETPIEESPPDDTTSTEETSATDASTEKTSATDTTSADTPKEVSPEETSPETAPREEITQTELDTKTSEQEVFQEDKSEISPSQ